MFIQNLSLEQTHGLLSVAEAKTEEELRDLLEQFILDYGYDESEHDDLAYEIEVVTYEHRSICQGEIV